MKVFRVLLYFLIVLTLTSCQNPLAGWLSAQKKVETTEQKIQKNEDASVDSAKSFAYGTKIALDLSSEKTNKYVKVAYDLNERTVAILGMPPLDEILALKIMITNLVSENQKDIIRGEKELAEMDDRVIELQNDKKELGEKLEKAQSKLEEIGSVNATMAQKFANLKKYFWWCVWGCIIYFILKVLTQVLPAPYDAISGILALPFSLIIRAVHAIFPDVKKYAGVVSTKTYEESQKALHAVVESIETAKTKMDSQNAQSGKVSVGLETLKTELDKNTDVSTKITINRAKENLGYV